MLLIDQDVDKAVKYCQNTLQKVLTRELPFEDYVITNALSRSAKDYKQKKAHVEVNNRVAQRTPGREKHEGDRIEYVMTTRVGKKAAGFEMAEDPDFAKEHHVPLNVQWYVENQLRKPITRLLKGVMSKERISSEVFNGPHMNKRKAETPRSDMGIGLYTQMGGKPSFEELVATAPKVEPSLKKAKTAAPAAKNKNKKKKAAPAAAAPAPAPAPAAAPIKRPLDEQEPPSLPAAKHTKLAPIFAAGAFKASAASSSSGKKALHGGGGGSKQARGLSSETSSERMKRLREGKI
jgi:hypothetical protein